MVKASTPLGAGLGFSKNMCGCLTSAALALGLKYGRTDLSASRKPSWSRAARLVENFTKKYHTVCCGDITDKFNDFSGTSRIHHCMEIIAFTTSQVAGLLFDPNDGFNDVEKERHLERREKYKA